MLHRTVFVLFLSMLVGAMTALAMSADSLYPHDVNAVPVKDKVSATPASSSHFHQHKRAADPLTHYASTGRLPHTAYPAR